MEEIFPIINGRVVRGTILDQCGVPAYGDYVSVTSEGFVSVAVTANYDDGTAIQVRNANGRFCVNKAAVAELLNLGVTVVFCGVDPDFYTALTGFPKLVDPLTGKTIGFKVDRSVSPGDTKAALEVWSDATDSAGCSVDDEFPYAYQLWPFLQGGKFSDYTIENNAVNFTVTNMLSLDDAGWLAGPYLVMTDDEGDPDVLSGDFIVGADDHEVIFRTVVPPPLPSNGLVPLDDPADADATTATAGTAPAAGTFDGVRPADLAGMSGITASPATAWTTGEYCILGDGSWCHWNSTTWVAGKA